MSIINEAEEGFPYQKVKAALEYLIAIKPVWSRFSKNIEIIPSLTPPLSNEPFAAIASTDPDGYIYLDNSFARYASIEEIAGVLEFEFHIHARRFWSRLPDVSNEDWRDFAAVSISLEINSAVDREEKDYTPRVKQLMSRHSRERINGLPPNGFFAEYNIQGPPSTKSLGSFRAEELGLPSGLSAEKYFELLKEARDKVRDEEAEDDEDMDEQGDEGEQGSGHSDEDTEDQSDQSQEGEESLEEDGAKEEERTGSSEEEGESEELGESEEELDSEDSDTSQQGDPQEESGDSDNTQEAEKRSESTLDGPESPEQKEEEVGEGEKPSGASEGDFESDEQSSDSNESDTDSEDGDGDGSEPGSDSGPNKGSDSGSPGGDNSQEGQSGDSQGGEAEGDTQMGDSEGSQETSQQDSGDDGQSSSGGSASSNGDQMSPNQSIDRDLQAAQEIMDRLDTMLDDDNSFAWKSSLFRPTDTTVKNPMVPEVMPFVKEKIGDQARLSEALDDFSEDILEFSQDPGLLNGESDDPLIQEISGYRRSKKVDFASRQRRVMTSAVQSAKTSGATDMSLSVRNPNQPMIGPIMAGVFDYSPRIYFIQDVSRSMKGPYTQTAGEVFSEVCTDVAANFGAKTLWIAIDFRIRAVTETSMWSEESIWKTHRFGGGMTYISDLAVNISEGKLKYEGKAYPEPDVLVIMTDGEFTWPSERPKVKTKWIITTLRKDLPNFPDWLRPDEIVVID